MDSYSNDYYTTSYTTYDAETAGAALAISAAAIVIGLLIAAAVYVVCAIFLGKIFAKAGVPSWIAWVPFYNNWKLLEIGGQQGFWAVLAILPIVGYVSAVFMYIAMYHIGKKLGKEGSFVVLGIFLPIVWFIWLGSDKSVWNDSASTAPSLHTPKPAA
jgi:hypothetical protein